MSRESWNKREWRYDPATLASGWVEVLDGEDQPIVETGNVQVEFPWGNFPLQPNDDRTNLNVTATGTEDYSWSPVTQKTSDDLAPDLDNHSIATGLPPYRFPGWNGYPGYLPGDNDNLPGNFVVPDLVGLPELDAGYTLAFAGFSITVNYIDNAGGATPENNGIVASQSPTAGHTIERGSTVTTNIYQYVAPEVFSWDLADWTGNSIHTTYGLFFTYGGLRDAMIAATPSMGGNGWVGYKLNCQNVVLDNMGMTIYLADGDYVITGSANSSMAGPTAIVTVDTSAGMTPAITGGFSFVSGRMAIVE